MQNKILQALQAICEYVAAYSYWRPLETMGKYLVIIRQVVNHLAQTPGLFPSSEAHKEFFTTLHRHVRLAYCSLDIFKEFRAERNKIIEEWVKELPRDDGDIYTDKLHWRTWAHNTVPIGSEEMRKAIVRKSNFKLMSSFLPRGGCAIAERWRADVNDAVNEMLQVR